MTGDRETDVAAPLLARKGVDAELVRAARNRIDAAVLARAGKLFAPGGGPESLDRPRLKRLERVLHFYDYQACCISPLGRAAAAGVERAQGLVETILANARRYLDEVRPGLEAPVPLRRLLLHVARAYGFLRGRLTARQRGQWQDLAVRMGEDLIEHNRQFFPGLKRPHNATVGTGVNHVAIAAEGVFFAGRAFDRPDWCELAGGFLDRLIAFCHPDGYFEENTNDGGPTREGGPSLDYTNLSLGAAYHVCRLRGNLQEHADIFRRCAALSRCLSETRLEYLTFADERTNRLKPRTFGWAAHSLSPEGRGYLRLLLGGPIGEPIEQMSLQMLARLDHELDGVRAGAERGFSGLARSAEPPEPWREGDTRLSLPLAVRRRCGWTCGLSALRALNREINPESNYALDRQNLLSLTHRSTGRILSGFKSKRDADWSTLRVGEDAWPVETGSLRLSETELVATVRYRTFGAEVGWRLGERAALSFTSRDAGEILAQLPLELGIGESLVVNDERRITLGKGPVEVAGVRAVAANAWRAEADREGLLRWPVGPHEPYNQGNRSGPEAWRLLWVLGWTGLCRVEFALARR